MEFLWALADIRTPFLDEVFGLVTRLGEEVVAIAILGLLYWCVNKNMAIGIGISYFFSGMLMQGLKITCRVERPWIRDPAFRPVESALGTATGYSFPSGHTQSAGALFGSMGFQFKRVWPKLLCFAAVVLVGFSRMYLGVHTPADVLVGMALSLAIAYAVARFIAVDSISQKRDGITALILIVFALAILTLGLLLRHANVIDSHYAADCCKTAGAGVGFAVGMYIERRYIRFDTSCKNIWMHILKYVLGIAGVLLIKEGLKWIAGSGLIMDMTRYFLLILWAICLYPFVIQKVFARNKTN